MVDTARQLRVRGWVRNRDDGAVELTAEGERAQLDRLLEGERTAISGLTFSVPRGQIMGFLGPNGAGKSTTMRILTGYIGATSGSASVAGFDVFRQSLEVRRRVGYLPETAPLYEEMRVHGFLDFISKVRRVPPSKRAERIDAAIEACGLEDRRDDVIGGPSRRPRHP